MTHDPSPITHHSSLITSFDPVTLEVLWNRLISMANDQARALVRVAFSTILREAEDLSAAIFDPQGNMLVQAVTGTPGHINTLALAVGHMLRRYPVETLEPGDSLITNDPWIASGHKHDMTIVTPIFRGSRLVALFGSTAHVVDVGGRVFSADAPEVYEEGLAIPIMKLFRRGQPNADLFEIIAENVRVPEEVIGGIRALVAGNEVGGQRLLEFMEEYRLEGLEELGQAILSRSEEAARRATATLPAGTYRHTVHLDGLDPAEPLTVAVAITVDSEQGDLLVDYTGTSPQVNRGTNVPFNYSYAYTAFAAKCAIFPELPNNGGAFRPVRMVAPEGCLLNARFPAAVAARHLSGYFTSSAVFGCLAQLLPERVIADPGMLSDMQLDGVDRTGRKFAYLFFVTGGLGARPGKDGVGTISYPGNIANTPVEIVENASPVFILEKEFIPDSGGPGRERGGPGQVVRAQVRTAQPATLSCLFERTRFPAEGLCGGRAGSPTEILINADVRPHPKRKHPIRPSDVITLRTGGGGGYGDPLTRPPEKVQRDVAQGLVSLERAAADYGVAIDPATLAIDREKTGKLREGRPNTYRAG